MRLSNLSLFTVGALSGSLVAASPRSPAPVCQIARDAAKLIGQRVRVEGYVWNLGTHGFVLTGERQCKSGLLSLSAEHVSGTPIWRKAFADKMGVRRAVLTGTVRWKKFEFGHRPALSIERVEHVGRREADLPNFWRD